MTVQAVRERLMLARVEMEKCYGFTMTHLVGPLDENTRWTYQVIEKLEETYGGSIILARDNYHQINVDISNLKFVFETVNETMGAILDPLEAAWQFVLQAVGQNVIEAQVSIALANQEFRAAWEQVQLVVGKVSQAIVVSHLDSANQLRTATAYLRQAAAHSDTAKGAVLQTIDDIDRYMRTL